MIVFIFSDKISSLEKSLYELITCGGCFSLFLILETVAKRMLDQLKHDY